MDVDATEPRNVEHRLRQNQAVGRDNEEIGLGGNQRFVGRWVLESLGLMNRNTVFERQLLDRARL